MVPRVLSGESQNLSDADALTLLLEMKLRRRRERPSLPRTVTELVAEDGSRVYVVGTAHFSDDSRKDVVKVRPARRAGLGRASPSREPPRLLRDTRAPREGIAETAEPAWPRGLFCSATRGPVVSLSSVI